MNKKALIEKKNEDTKTKEANTADDELQVLKEKGLAAYLKLKKGK